MKPCDKGAGIIILNFQEYLKACQSHLNKTYIDNGGAHNPYYSKVDLNTFEEAKNNVKLVLEEGLDNENITKDEYEAMLPEEKNPAKFYLTFKVHKEHSEGQTPPERPIVSGSGSVNENIGHFVEHHIKNLAQKHETFLKDTPDLLRYIEKVNENEHSPQNAILVSMDVSAVYTNIPQSEGIECVREALNEVKNKKIPTEFIIRLLDITLKENIFEFNEELFKQIIGTAMGSKPAPSYANLFMARRIDNIIFAIIKLFENNEILSSIFFKRFLDDLIFIFTGSTKALHQFLEAVNQIHPNIKFTMQHTSIHSEPDPCNCNKSPTIPFLDTSLQIVDGEVIVDLYRKPTDRNQYLLPTSCHPPHCTTNIPFSLAMRIVRICSKPETRDSRLKELKQLLLDRKYNVDMIDSAIRKARAIPRCQAIKSVAKPQPDARPVFAVTFDTRLPNMQSIVNKHWRAMVNMDSYLSDVFPDPPMIAYRCKET